MSKENSGFKVGKWMKSESGSLVFVESIQGDTFTGYGFDYRYDWINSKKDWIVSAFKTEATNEEVEKALIIEANRRSVWNVPIKEVHGNEMLNDILASYYDPVENVLWSNYGMVFQKGKWATPISEGYTVPVPSFENGPESLVAAEIERATTYIPGNHHQLEVKESAGLKSKIDDSGLSIKEFEAKKFDRELFIGDFDVKISSDSLKRMVQQDEMYKKISSGYGFPPITNSRCRGIPGIQLDRKSVV